MNAHHKSALPVASASPPTNPAQNLIAAARLLFPRLEAGKPIDAKILRAAMEEAFGASDTEGTVLNRFTALGIPKTHPVG